MGPFETWASSNGLETSELFSGLVFWVLLGFESGVLRFLGEEDWAWGFFLEAAARAPDMRASKAEGREDMVVLGLGFGEKAGLRKEKGLGGKREEMRGGSTRRGERVRVRVRRGERKVWVTQENIN